MPQKWTGKVVGTMHNEKITRKQLASKLGVTKAYVSMILSGARTPVGAQQRIETALDELISEQKGGHHAEEIHR